MNGRPACGRTQAGRCSGASTLARRGGSNAGGLAGGVVAERPLGLPVEFAGGDILLKLTVPCLRIKGREPMPEVGELLIAQLLDVTLNGLDFAHSLSQNNGERGPCQSCVASFGQEAK
jgi:hypothetical protein